MKKLLYILMVLVAIGVVFILLNDTRQSKETKKVLRVGVIAPFTGKGAVRGEDTLLGLRMAESKAAELLPEYEIQFITQDVPLDQAKLAPAAFRHLVEIEKVDAIIGPLGSNVSLAIEPLVDSLKVPTIVHAASALAVTEDNEFIFRMWPTADRYAQEIINRLDKEDIKKLEF